MTELNKFEIVGLLHFQKGILPSHVAKFLFQKKGYIFCFVREYIIYYVLYIYIYMYHFYIDTKSDNKLSTKNEYTFILDYSGVGKSVCGV